MFTALEDHQTRSRTENGPGELWPLATMREPECDNHETRCGTWHSTQRANLSTQSLHEIHIGQILCMLSHPSQLCRSSASSVARRLPLPILTVGPSLAMVNHRRGHLSRSWFTSSLFQNNHVTAEWFVSLRSTSLRIAVALVFRQRRVRSQLWPFSLLSPGIDSHRDKFNPAGLL